MADNKISALTALTGASVDATADVLAIEDISVTTTKKITIDEALLAMLASTTNARFKVGTFTRVMSVASGDVAYTGVGFKPKAIVIFGYVSNGVVKNSTKGFSDASTNSQILDYTTTGADSNTTGSPNVIYLFDDAATLNVNAAIVKTFDTDGFTLTWAKSGTPTMTANLAYLAFR